jgi:hypothetical protein
MSTTPISRATAKGAEEAPSDPSVTTDRYQEIIEKLKVVDCPTTQTWLDSMLTSLHAVAIAWEDPLSKFPATVVPKPEVHLLNMGTYAVHVTVDGRVLVGIDKQLLLEMNNVDAIAFAIAHELGHQAYKERYGSSRSARASVAEEMFCDHFALNVMTIAGYSPQGALDLFDHFIDQRERQPQRTEIQNLIDGVQDEHFSDHTRWAQLKEDFVGVTRLTTGRCMVTGDDRQCESLPEEVTQALEQAHFISVIERALVERHFAEAPLDKQLMIISEVLSLVTYSHRADDVLLAVGGLIKKHGKEIVQHEEFHELFDQLLGRSLAQEPAYKGVACPILKRLERQNKEVPLLGTMRDLDRVAQYHLGSEESPPPTSEVVRRVRRIARVCDGSADLPIKLEAARPPLEIPWKVSIDSAIQAASADPTGLKASLLYATLCHDHYFSRVIDRLPLEVLEASLDYCESPILHRMVEERRWWERDVSSYALFRENPIQFLHNFAPGLVAPDLIRVSRQYCAAHPYARREESRTVYEMFRPTSEIVMGHLERFLVEHPAQGRLIARALFLGREASDRQKLKLTKDATIPFEIGCEKYPVDGPLATFVLRHRKLFPGSDLDQALLHIGVRVALPDFESLIGVTYPRTISQLERMTRTPFAHPIFSPASGFHGELLWRFIEDVVRASPASPQSIEQIVKIIVGNEYVFGLLPFSGSAGLREALRDSVFTSPTQQTEKFYRSMSVNGLISLVKLGETASLFPSAREKELISAVLAEKLRGVYPEVLRARLCSMILTIPPTVIELRETTTSHLANYYRHRFGRDSGSTVYSELLKRQLVKDMKKMPPDIRHLLSRKIADAVESQEALSYALRDVAGPSDAPLEAYHVPLKGAETLFRAAGKTSERMEATLEFLLEPVTPDSVDRYRVAIRAWEVLSDKERSDLGCFFLSSDSESESRRQQAISLHTLHRYVSSLSVETRAVVMKQILVAPERLHSDSEAAYQHAVRFTLDRIFPSTREASAADTDPSSRWSRLMVESFVVAAHPSERGYLLAAMLAAGQSSAGSTVRAGVQLKRLLEHLGPAYIKLGQAIHSYPSTPREIREDLAGLKGMAAVPPRWELFEMISERMDPSIRGALARVGKIRGAASFNIVVTYRDQRGRPGAFALLRPYALERALKGFDDLRRMVDIVVERDPSLGRFKDDAIDILRHAREMTNTETDMRLGLLQHASARRRYEGKRYIAHGVPFRMTTARWRDVGEGYRTMDEAPGDSFDALPERTSTQRWFKRAVAKVIISGELESILSGGGFDYDRHERQYHVAGTTIIALDHGGEALTAPTAEDRRCLASLVGRLAERLMSHDGNGEALHAALEQGLGKDDYAQRLQKALLALSGILSYLTPSDLAGIVASCWIQGDVCQEVDAALTRVIPDNTGIGQLRATPAWLRNIVLWRKSGVTKISHSCDMS